MTGSDGRFTFRARAVRRTPSEAGWSEALFPLVWLDTVRVRVWQKDYIGVDSDRHGLWWLQEEPPASKGNCLVVRDRLPFLGYHYKILLKRALTEEQWTIKINSVSLGNIDEEEGAYEQERLFSDLTGYLERWPQGERAHEYLVSLFDLAIAMGGPFCAGDIHTVSKTSSIELKTMLGRMQKTLALVDALPGPDEAKDPVRARNWPEERDDLRNCVEAIRRELLKREGSPNGR